MSNKNIEEENKNKNNNNDNNNNNNCCSNCCKNFCFCICCCCDSYHGTQNTNYLYKNKEDKNISTNNNIANNQLTVNYPNKSKIDSICKKGFFNSKAYKQDICYLCNKNFESRQSIFILPCQHISHIECTYNYFINQSKCPIDSIDIL